MIENKWWKWDTEGGLSCEPFLTFCVLSHTHTHTLRLGLWFESCWFMIIWLSRLFQSDRDSGLGTLLLHRASLHHFRQHWWDLCKNKVGCGCLLLVFLNWNHSFCSWMWCDVSKIVVLSHSIHSKQSVAQLNHCRSWGFGSGSQSGRNWHNKFYLVSWTPEGTDDPQVSVSGEGTLARAAWFAKGQSKLYKGVTRWNHLPHFVALCMKFTLSVTML